MLGGLFSSLTEIVGDVVEVATMPFQIAVDATKITTAPVAKAAKEIKKEFKEMADEIIKDIKE